MMTIRKALTIGSTLVFSVAAVVAGGGIAVVRASRGEYAQNKPQSVAPPQAKPAAVLPQTGPVNPLMQQLLEVARRRLDAQLESYHAGNASVRSILEASDRLDEIELRAAREPAERRTVKERRLKNLRTYEELAKNHHKAGQMSAFDVDDVLIRRLEAEISLNAPDAEQTDSAAILKGLNGLEKRVQDLEKRVPRGLGGSL
jgi:hypothetical protein